MFLEKICNLCRCCHSHVCRFYPCGSHFWYHFPGIRPSWSVPTGRLCRSLVTAWLLFIAYVAVLVAIATLLRSNGAAIATNICLVSIFPTLLQAPDFLFGRIGLKIFPVWIGEKLSSVTSLPLPSGAVMAGILIAILYVIAAGAVGIICSKNTT